MSKIQVMFKREDYQKLFLSFLFREKIESIIFSKQPCLQQKPCLEATLRNSRVFIWGKKSDFIKLICFVYKGQGRRKERESIKSKTAVVYSKNIAFEKCYLYFFPLIVVSSLANITKHRAPNTCTTRYLREFTNKKGNCVLQTPQVLAGGISYAVQQKK